jgi:hypothetical protein
MILTLPVAGCMRGAGDEISGPALCAGTAAPATAHAAALARDGGDESVVTGARLIAVLDAGCRR